MIAYNRLARSALSLNRDYIPVVVLATLSNMGLNNNGTINFIPIELPNW